MKSNSPHYEDEISLKELIQRFQGWLKYLWSKWLVILLFALVGVGLGLIYALNSKPVYVAELTFVLEDSKSNSLGAYVGLANQFGIDLGSGSGSGIFSGDNILEFLKSRLMVEKALLSPVIYKGTPTSLADYYISINKMRDSWSKNLKLKKLHFPVTPRRNTFSLQHDSILNVIYEKIISNNLIISKPDKKLSFILVKCTTSDELFSKLFTERLVKEAIDFYIQTKTRRSQITVDKLQAKADSLEDLLNRKTYSVAESQDMNFNPARSMAGVKTELVARDKIVLQTMYGEVVKNLELSKMNMEQETPIIQIVDTPILPLEKKKWGIIKGIVVGGFISTFLIIFILIVTHIYQKIMSN